MLAGLEIVVDLSVLCFGQGGYPENLHICVVVLKSASRVLLFFVFVFFTLIVM